MRKKSPQRRNRGLDRLIRDHNREFVGRCLADGQGGDGLLFACGGALVSSRAAPGEAQRRCRDGYYPS